MGLGFSTSQPKLCDDMPISQGSNLETGSPSSENAVASSSSVQSWGAPGLGTLVVKDLL